MLRRKTIMLLPPLIVLMSSRSQCFSTAASSKEYLFGAASVLEAMQQGLNNPNPKRRIQRLLLKENGGGGGGNGAGSSTGQGHGRHGYTKLKFTPQASEESKYLNLAVELAGKLSIPIEYATPSMLSRLSEGRPNQSMVLATSPYNVEFISELEDADAASLLEDPEEDEDFDLPDGRGGAGGGGGGGKNAFPLWLVLDRIMDPQNLGAILRSAQFFNVNGIVLSEREGASPSPLVSKASAGAMERMDIYKSKSLSKFLQKSIENGWLVLGTDLNAKNTTYLDDRRKGEALLIGPSILVLGNEGSGVKGNLSALCHKNLVIPNHSSSIGGAGGYQLDSLNVSVAAGIILHRLTSSRA